MTSLTIIPNVHLLQSISRQLRSSILCKMGDVNIEILKKEKNALIRAIESETADVVKLEKYLSDLNFQKIQNNPKEKWTAESYVQKNSKDPLSYVQIQNPVPEKSAVKKLGTIIDQTESLLQLKCEDLAYTLRDDGLLLYKAKCSMIGSKLGFLMTFTCKSLDSKTVKLESVKLTDQTQTADLKLHLAACVKMNNIPILIQSLSDFTVLDQQRTVFLEEMKKNLAKDILLTKKSGNQNDGVIVLILVDPVLKNPLLKVKWAIVSCLKTMKFSYCFTLRSEPEGQWLRKEHGNVIQDIVEVTAINEQTVAHWETLCNLVTSHYSKKQKKK